jgi:hypothetical protein
MDVSLAGLIFNMEILVPSKMSYAANAIIADFAIILLLITIS